MPNPADYYGWMARHPIEMPADTGDGLAGGWPDLFWWLR